jgi:hypothetical protein
VDLYDESRTELYILSGHSLSLGGDKVEFWEENLTGE